MGDVVRLQSTRPVEPAEPVEHPVMPPLWREAVGAEIRRARHDAERTLGDVAARAGISTPYLSEVERGLKEPSSEVLEAIAGALELRLVDLTYRVTRQLAAALPSRRVPVAGPSGPLALELRLVDLTYRVTRQLAAALPSRRVPVAGPSGPLALAL